MTNDGVSTNNNNNMNLLRLLAISGALNMILTLMGTISTVKRSAGGVIDEAIMFHPPNFYADNNSTAAADNVDNNNIDIDIETVLIIATVPYNKDHATALWTALECVADGIDRIVLSAPDAPWSRNVVAALVNEFELRNNSTAAGRGRLEVAYYTNDRYDAGLWCDALSHHLGFDGVRYTIEKDQASSSINNNSSDRNNNNTASATTAAAAPPARPRAIFLINDSVIALRRYRDLTDKILKFSKLERQNITSHRQANLKLVSLNGRLETPARRKWYYVESVYRGLTPEAVSAFYDYTCADMRDCFRYAEVPEKQMMKCIVNHYEIGVAGAFKDDEIDAMFPSKLRTEYDVNDVSKFVEQNGSIDPNELWIRGRRFWQYLWTEHNFPFRKLKGKANVNGECLALLGDNGNDWFDKLPFPSGEDLQQFQAEMRRAGANQ